MPLFRVRPALLKRMLGAPSEERTEAWRVWTWGFVSEVL
jgi:hypothetical protein